jgi:hypothetical protein
MDMKDRESLPKQSASTPASLISHDAAHVFDNAAVEFQLSADREEMVAPGIVYSELVFAYVPENINAIVKFKTYHEY